MSWILDWDKEQPNSYLTAGGTAAADQCHFIKAVYNGRLLFFLLNNVLRPQLPKMDGPTDGCSWCFRQGYEVVA